MKFYAIFNEDGTPVRFMDDQVYPDVVVYGVRPDPTDDDPNPKTPEVSRDRNSAIPAEAVEITRAQFSEFVDNQGLRKWKDGAVAVFDPPRPPDPPVVVYKVDFYRRLTDDEAVKVEDAIAQQSTRQRRIFESAQTFRSDAPEWSTLTQLAKDLFGEDRAKELLAPSQG